MSYKTQTILMKFGA